jgi:cytochrome c oxidase assembly protein subunit 15
VKTLARLGTASVILTYLHLVFGGIVRISGSGMGCGDSWPRCNGSWIPPFDNATVLVEYTHRLLALLVTISITWLAAAAWRRRNEPGVGGAGGVLRPAGTALALVVVVALVGMVTVKLGNLPSATVAHWTLAMTLLAVVIIAAVRAGALGGAFARAQGGTPRAVRSLGAGAVLAFVAVVMGGLVAKVPGAAVACTTFFLCGRETGTSQGVADIQLTHRVVAYVLFFHVLGVATAVSRRAGEAAAVKRAATVAASLVILQVVIGLSMVMSGLRAPLRSAHEAVGVGVWLSMFLAAYLARTAARAATR